MPQDEKPRPQVASSVEEGRGSGARPLPPKLPKKNGRPSRNGHERDDKGEALQEILDALQAMRVGDFSVRLPRDQDGIAGKIADVFNEIVAGNERMANQLEEVGQIVG